ncbi:hypothetical protein B0H15DRAFT_804122 [Mycena belliarum]|uniref:Uncharacterized protein n=1 Tax=Mycena belliarum TaxID=1033014 RepID=A0AAD6XMK3_9AGAR|nr:hypothetical protein B0H15DRAFT_804122 [Mycena belliae]
MTAQTCIPRQMNHRVGDNGDGSGFSPQHAWPVADARDGAQLVAALGEIEGRRRPAAALKKALADRRIVTMAVGPEPVEEMPRKKKGREEAQVGFAAARGVCHPGEAVGGAGAERGEIGQNKRGHASGGDAPAAKRVSSGVCVDAAERDCQRRRDGGRWAALAEETCADGQRPGGEGQRSGDRDDEPAVKDDFIAKDARVSTRHS